MKEASAVLQKLYREQEGTINWGDVDFWEKRLGMKLWEVRKISSI